MFKKISLLAILLVILVLIYWGDINSAVDPKGQDLNFTVNKGETINQVAADLKKQALIKSAWLFRYFIYLKQANIIAGQYLLNPAMTTARITEILTSGQALSDEKSITIIEGWRLDDINSYLKNNDILTDDKFKELTEAKLGYWRFSFAKPGFLSDAPDSADLEGYLFPDTYRIFAGATGDEIIARLLDNFNKKLSAVMRQEIEKNNRSIFETVVMASIIEKEARTPTDMKIVAGIFWDRIKNKIPLQSDATLSYILDDNQPSHSLVETKIDSPYNTYKYLGLPPGPICNPGLNAIMATIYPQYTDYNYFLTRSDNGQTVFSKTLEEHNLNKVKYLK